MAEPIVKVTGIAQVTKRLYVKKGETAKGTERGLVIAGIALQRMSQRVVPVDTGRLRSSAFTAKSGSGFSTKVTVGYTTPYAVYVHEDLQAKHSPGKIAKYIEVPARTHKKQLIKIVRDEAKRGSQGSIPQLLPPDFTNHALLAIPEHTNVRPLGFIAGKTVTLVGGKKVTYVRAGRSKSGRGGFRRKR